jgi:hypothetical protein
MEPRQEIVHKAFREAFGPVHAREEDAAEDLHDGGGIGRRKRQELSIAIENAIRNQGTGMRIEVGPVAPEGLQGDDAAGADVTAVKERLEGFQDRGVGGLGQKAESREAGRSRSMRPRRTRGMEKVQWRCGTGARISELSFSAKRTERLAWQLEQKFLVRQENARRCSA